MFEGMSDDDEDFQSVSQSSWIEIKNVNIDGV